MVVAVVVVVVSGSGSGSGSGIDSHWISIDFRQIFIGFQLISIDFHLIFSGFQLVFKNRMKSRDRKDSMSASFHHCIFKTAAIWTSRV